MDIYTQIPNNYVPEGSSFTATAYFRTADAGDTPTTARYRIDDITTGAAVRAWTTLTPADSIAIAVTPDDNVSKTSQREERKKLTVEIDTALDTQTRKQAYWTVKNIAEF